MEVGRLSRFRQRGDGGLQISGLVPDDTGMLQCFARNAAGEAQTSTYLAVTSESPSLSCPSPRPPPTPPHPAFLRARGLLRTGCCRCKIGSQKAFPPERGHSGLSRLLLLRPALVFPFTNQSLDFLFN